MKYPDKSCLIVDHGAYVNVALKLAESFGKVYYYTPWQKSFPNSNDTLVGSGFPQIERINRFWEIYDKVDLFVFTDIYHSDLQQYLVSQGKRVWGPSEGDSLEIYKWDFLQYLKKIGLDVAPTELIVGMENLRKHLKGVEDKYVKVDAMTRGDIETFHHLNYDITEAVLDRLAYRLGPNKEKVHFLVQDPIPSKSEVGYDGYTIDGLFPEESLFGIEVKDKGYVGEVRKYADLPKEIQLVNEKLAPALRAYQYRGMWSTEIRLGTDGKVYFIDPTCRFPAPPTAVMLELYSNMAEIMYEGADGKMVQPLFEGKYGAEVVGTCEILNKGSFAQVFFPDSEKRWIKQLHPFMIDGKVYTVPQNEDPRICEVVAIGDTLEATLKKIEERCEEVKGHKIELDCSVLSSAAEELTSL